MSHVFISYARTDTDFVRRLHEAFAERDRETWVDWEGIPPSDKWMERIHAAIDQAEAFVFVISPDSVASAVCGQELDYAIQHNKRLVPVLYREPQAPVRSELAEINYIFVRESDPFEPAFATIVRAIDTDLEWVHAHTRLLVRAVEWDRNARDLSYTLRGSDLNGFEEWAARAPDKEPKPTVLQSEYLLASRRAVTRRQRIAWASVAAGLCIAVGLGTVAWFQNRERDRQAEIASARQLLSQAEALRDIPDAEDQAHVQHRNSLRVAAQALAALDRLGEPVFDADQSLRKSYARLSKWVDTDLGPDRILASAFDPTGQYLGYYTMRPAGPVAVVRDTISGEVVTACTRTGHAMDSQFKLTVSADGNRLGLYVYNASGSNPSNTVTVWSLPDCGVLLERRLADSDRTAFTDFALTRDGATLVAIVRYRPLLWDVATGAMRRFDGDVPMRAFATSPDGARIAAYERARGERVRWIRVRDLNTGAVLHEWQVEGLVRAIRWVPAGILVDTKPAMLYTGDGLEIARRETAGDQVVASEDGRYFAAREPNGTVTIDDVASGDIVAQNRRDAQFANIAFQPNGRSVVAVGTYGVDLSAWHFARGGAYSVLETGGRPLWMRFAADGSELRVEYDQGTAAWKLPSPGSGEMPVLVENTLNPEARPHAQPAVGLPDGDGDPLVLGEALGRSGKRATIVAGEMTRAGYRRTLEVWDGGEKHLEKPYGPVFESGREGIVQFVGLDNYLVIGMQTGLEMVATATLEPVATLYHTGAILAGAQPDGRRAATMDADRTVRVWEIASGLELARFTADQSARALELSGDDRWLAALGTEGRIRLWATAPADLIVQACQWLEPPCP